jgi:hypothetical protein
MKYNYQIFAGIATQNDWLTGGVANDNDYELERRAA